MQLLPITIYIGTTILIALVAVGGLYRSVVGVGIVALRVVGVRCGGGAGAVCGVC